MIYAYVRRFDMTGTAQKFLRTKQCIILSLPFTCFPPRLPRALASSISNFESAAATPLFIASAGGAGPTGGSGMHFRLAVAVPYAASYRSLLETVGSASGRATLCHRGLPTPTIFEKINGKLLYLSL